MKRIHNAHQGNAYNHHHACEFYFSLSLFLFPLHSQEQMKSLPSSLRRLFFPSCYIIWLGSCTKPSLGVELSNEQHSSKVKESLINWIIRYPGCCFLLLLLFFANIPIPLIQNHLLRCAYTIRAE